VLDSRALALSVLIGLAGCVRVIDLDPADSPAGTDSPPA
jgi:hypothetical protein